MTAELIERLNELHAKADPADWAIDQDDRPGMNWNNHIVRADEPNMAVCFMTHDNTPENEIGQANAELIVELKNAWPQISAALESLMRERDALAVKADAEMERVKACEHIAEGDEGWQTLRNLCPSTAAVASLRDRAQAATAASVAPAAAAEQLGLVMSGEQTRLTAECFMHISAIAMKLNFNRATSASAQDLYVTARALYENTRPPPSASASSVPNAGESTGENDGR